MPRRKKKLEQFSFATKSSLALAARRLLLAHIATVLSTPGRVAFMQTRSAQVTGSLHTLETVTCVLRQLELQNVFPYCSRTAWAFTH